MEQIAITPEWKWDIEEGDVMEIKNSEGVRVNVAGPATVYANVSKKSEPINLNFGQALQELRAGKKVAREGWKGKGMFAVYQKGYPDGIPSNKQTAEAWGMNEGDLFKVRPYLQLKTAQGDHAMWNPTTSDILAEDWQVVK